MEDAWPIVIAVLVSALSGLGGVVVGQRLEIRASRQAERERRDAARIVAARLIAEELVEAGRAMNHAMEHFAWWGEELATHWWRTHAGDLAGLLSDLEWRLVIEAQQQIQAGERSRRMGVNIRDAYVDMVAAEQKVWAAVTALYARTFGYGDEALEPDHRAVLTALQEVGTPAEPEKADAGGTDVTPPPAS